MNRKWISKFVGWARGPKLVVTVNAKITPQKLSWTHFWGAVILIGDLSDFRTASSGKMGLWEK